MVLNHPPPRLRDAELRPAVLSFLGTTPIFHFLSQLAYRVAAVFTNLAENGASEVCPRSFLL